MIDKPGIYEIDDATYHGDPTPTPSLSSGVARRIVEQSPLHGWTAHPRLNPDAEPFDASKEMDFGSVAHAMILGKGREIEVYEATDWRKKAAQEWRAEVRERGAIPILRPDHDRATAMVAAFWRQLALMPDWLLQTFRADGLGFSERVVIWQEPGGLWCRAKIDRLLIAPDRIVLVDFKSTTASAHPAAVSRRLYGMGQDVQLAFYRRGLRTIQPRSEPVGAILTQEVDAPWALSAIELDPATWAKADQQVEAAIAAWRHGLATGDWPGYPPLVATAELPGWVESDWVNRRDTMQAPPGLTIISAG